MLLTMEVKEVQAMIGLHRICRHTQPEVHSHTRTAFPAPVARPVTCRLIMSSRILYGLPDMLESISFFDLIRVCPALSGLLR